VNESEATYAPACLETFTNVMYYVKKQEAQLSQETARASCHWIFC